MPNIARPFGLLPFTNIATSAGELPGEQLFVPMTTNVATAMAKGDIVTLNSGSAGVATATPTTTRSANTPHGICTGFEFVTPTGDVRSATFLPANAINSGFTRIKVFYIENPLAKFIVQATAAVTAAQIGSNAPLTMTAATANLGAQLALTAASIATTATLAVRILGFQDPVNGPTETFPNLICAFNTGVHALSNSTGA